MCTAEPMNVCCRHHAGDDDITPPLMTFGNSQKKKIFPIRSECLGSVAVELSPPITI